MRTLSVAGGAVIVALCLPAAAGAEGAFPKTRVGFMGPADRLWEGSVELAPCARGRPPILRLLLPPRPVARQVRRGEVIAEFSGAAPIAPSTVAQARQCAASAGAAATAPVLLTGGAPGFSKFQSEFSACMTRADAAQAVGSMTLWVDNRCNW